VKGYLRKLTLPLVALVVLAVAGTAGGAASKGGTLVFGTASDPVVLDGALISDGESGRVIDQLYEGLVALKPGSTQIVPSLATSWKASGDGKTWIFNLRHGVRFHDGTAFNSAAVCFNFNRWYNFSGSFQNPDATYYWQTVFGGFHHPEQGSPKGSLYKACRPAGPFKVRLILTKRSASFLGALSLGSFSMESPTAMKKYGANKGSVDSDGVFHPTGTYGTKHPTGTGPFKFKSWSVGNKLEIVRYAGYWGKKAKVDRVIFQPISNNTARLQALQNGEIQGYDLVAPQDIATLKKGGFRVLSRPAFNVAYVGFNYSKPPMDKLAVRQAIAYGLDRQSVVRAFYAGRAVVAKEFMPPQVIGYAKDVKTYPFNPEKAKSLLRGAGLKLPVDINFWYPTNVSRPYMPDPKRNFEGFAASLERSGFHVIAHSAPWRPDYLSAIDRGDAQMYLVGWTGDFGDPDNFIGTFFRTPQDAWGNFPASWGIYKILNKALAETNLKKRVQEYKQANRLIMKYLPGVPYAHSSPALGFKQNVHGYVPSPVSLEPFSLVSIGGK
jgi:peptide/nickel transport system substrate-binding protein